MRKTLLMMAATLFAASTMSAATLCSLGGQGGPGGGIIVSDTSAPGFTTSTFACDTPNFMYDQFALSVTGVTDANIGLLGVSGDDLLFSVSTNPPVVTQNSDLRFNYRVTALGGGSLYAIDASIGAASGQVGITEIACSQAFTNGLSCGGTELANLTVSTAGPTMAIAFLSTPTKVVYIGKDIGLVANSRLSDFENSHHIPEPATSLLFGTALLGLGYIRYRRGKNK